METESEFEINICWCSEHGQLNWAKLRKYKSVKLQSVSFVKLRD
jgi:hypothetical protein